MGTITCLGDRKSGVFLIIASVSQTDNFVDVNVFKFGVKPQVGGIKIVTVWKRYIFQVEWLIATLIFLLLSLSFLDFSLGSAYL